MANHRAYRWLCGATGGLLVIAGALSFIGFFRFHMPNGSPPELFTMGPNGMYFVAFTGCALVAWGGVLLGGARDPAAAPWIATATSLGLAMCALYRMVAWIVGDYALLGNVLRVEAAIFLALATAFLWLRPTASTQSAVGEPRVSH